MLRLTPMVIHWSVYCAAYVGGCKVAVVDGHVGPVKVAT